MRSRFRSWNRDMNRKCSSNQEHLIITSSSSSWGFSGIGQHIPQNPILYCWKSVLRYGKDNNHKSTHQDVQLLGSWWYQNNGTQVVQRWKPTVSSPNPAIELLKFLLFFDPILTPRKFTWLGCTECFNTRWSLHFTSLRSILAHE